MMVVQFSVFFVLLLSLLMFWVLRPKYIREKKMVNVVWGMLIALVIGIAISGSYFLVDAGILRFLGTIFSFHAFLLVYLGGFGELDLLKESLWLLVLLDIPAYALVSWFIRSNIQMIKEDNAKKKVENENC